MSQVLFGSSLESKLSLESYSGRWFEIGHSPNWFQSTSNYNTTATYTLNPTNPSEVQVENITYSQSKSLLTQEPKVKKTSIQGIAKQLHPPNHLRVQLSPCKYKGSSVPQKVLNAITNLFSSKKKANYIIFALGVSPNSDHSYLWACVGDPKSKNCWILSRTPILPPDDLKLAFQILEDNGFNLKHFVMTDQTTNPV